MSTALVRRLGAGVALVALLMAFPAAAGATIRDGCTGEGHSTSSSANLTTDTVWHLLKADIAGGSGTAPGKIHSASVSAYALGIPIPIASGTSDEGKTAGSVEGVNVATYAVLGHRFVVGGSASGDVKCSGEIDIIIDDVNPLLTVLGGGGTILAIIGLIALLLFARSKGGCAYRVLSGFLCSLGGLGGALALEQFGVIDPTSFIGLFILIGAGVLGFVTCGLFGGGGDAPSSAPGVDMPAA
jgi:hypothetical protein